MKYDMPYAEYYYTNWTEQSGNIRPGKFYNPDDSDIPSNAHKVSDIHDIRMLDVIKVKPLTPDAPLPCYAHETDAGMDLHAVSIEAPGQVIVATCVVQPGQTVKVHTGIAVKLPHATFGAVYPRSGLASKTGLAPANMVGVIDENYTGEIIVALHNYSTKPQAFAIGDRIAQLVVQPYVHCVVNPVTELPNTDRGAAGFGSTGGNS